MDDFMIMNDGEQYDDTVFLTNEPEEQVRKRDVARSKAKANKDIIIQVLARLQKRAEFYTTVDSITLADREDPEIFMTKWNANVQTKINLELEIDYWKGELKLAK